MDTTDFSQEQAYLKAKKQVKEIKGFYIHFLVFILVNIFISGIIVYGLMQSGDSILEAFGNFGVWSTWLFWGIGLFFHWIGVFGFKSLIGKDWEERKIKEIMEKQNQQRR